MEKKDMVETYKDYVRPRVNANSIRMDDDLYRLNEIIRVFYSNEFISPTNADILRILLKKHVEQLREQDSAKIMDIERAIEMVSNEQKTSKWLILVL